MRRVNVYLHETNPRGCYVTDASTHDTLGMVKTILLEVSADEKHFKGRIFYLGVDEGEDVEVCHVFPPMDGGKIL